jgi:hypothetical protein
MIGYSTINQKNAEKTNTNKTNIMEFNTTATTQKKVNIAPSTEQDVTLISSSNNTINVLKEKLLVSVVLEANNTITISHNATDILRLYQYADIKSSLLTINGKKGRLFYSSKAIEAFNIQLNDFPAYLEYTLAVVEAGILTEYKGRFSIPAITTDYLLTLEGSSTSSIKTVSVPEAVESIDKELYTLKNNLNNIYYITSTSDKKVVPLHQLIQDLEISISKLTKEVDELKEKVKDL